MNIFADDQTNTNQKEIVRESLRTQGIEIGHSIADRLERERQERNKRDADLSAVLSYQDQLEKELFDLLTQRDAILKEVSELERQNAQLKRMAEAIAEGDLPERNPDGSFKDAALEALISAHEKKTGHSVDRSDGGVILQIIMAEQERVEEQHRQKSEELEQIERRIDGIEQELGEERASEIQSSYDQRVANFSDASEYNGKFLRTQNSIPAEEFSFS